MKQWIIRYYLTDASYRIGAPAFTETINGDRNFAVNWAQNKLRYSQFKYYDLVEK